MDPFVVSGLRIGVAFLVFLPFLRIGRLNFQLTWKFLLIGGIQFGVMYGAYIYTFQFMEAHKIALFTVTTPLMVTLVDDLLEKRFQSRFLLCAAMSVVGGWVIYFETVELEGTLWGIGLLQMSNLCFAIGQVCYRRLLLTEEDLRGRDHFALLYLGGLLATFVLALWGSDITAVELSARQWVVIVFLGIVASGGGFFLWNYGATLTNTGSLAVMNNLKIPLAVLVSLLFFETVEGAALVRLILGGGIIVGAVLLNESMSSRAPGETV